MKQFFSTDLAMKLLSLFLSVVLWFYLIVVLNPEIDVTVPDVPISFSGHQRLTQERFAITNEAQNTVTLKVRGPRSMVANINKNNITAYVDLTDYSQAGSFSLPIHVRLPYEEITVAEKKPYNINVVIDHLMTQQFKVSVQVNGTPKAGYAVLSASTTQTLVEVSGPEELIKTIDKAVVPIDVEGATDDIAMLKDIQLLDSNGDVITHKSISITPSKFEAHCTILKEKTVPVYAPLANGQSEWTASVPALPEIVILGEEDDLKNITAIYTKPVDAGSGSGDMQVTASLVIPPNIYLLEQVSEVTVELKRTR